MSMIQIENLTFSYPNGFDNIFENVTLRLDTDWKLGFVGRNGRGKTTLLNLLLGKYEYSGSIRADVPFDYFPYPVADKSKLTAQIFAEIAPMTEEWELIRELSYLEMDAETLDRPFDSLSNGEQTKVLLAALFCNEGRFLLIDEPTNHLDKQARAITAAYLKRKKGFILVSHDREFLDGCVDHILSINRANIELQSGNFSSWSANFERQQEAESAQNERLQKDIARLQRSAQRSAVWSDRVEASKKGAADKGYVGHKAAKMMKRSKSIEARRQLAVEQKSRLLRNAEVSGELKLSCQPYHSDTLASFSHAAVCYGGRAVCRPVSFTLQRGDRIALDGKNGSGKSSLLKLLVGDAVDYTGTVRIGSGLIVSYVPQDTSRLRGSLSDFARENHIEESLLKAILQKMGVEPIQFEKDMRDFSDGQKKKAQLAKSLCERAHVYVWDEPLNFIDIVSRMQIERLIRQFSPTMIFVEHDGAFRKAVATKTVPVLRV